jgi:hypothetical protein
VFSVTTMLIVALEDRDWFREESRRKGAPTDGAGTRTGSPMTVRPANDPRHLTRAEITWAFVAAGIQAAILVADEVGWLDVPFV